MKHYSVTRVNKLLIDVKMRMNLKSMLSERNQMQNVTYSMIPFI